MQSHFKSHESEATQSSEWVAYFESNDWDPEAIVEHKDVELSRRTKRSIARSIQTFQLGESGGGSHFLRVAEKWANQTGDYEYVTALELFIREEQRHAEALGHFMDRAGIPRIRKEASNHVFRWLRHLAGLELIVTVLLIAEVIARVYYPALRKATRSYWLRRICEQLSRDEIAHIRFQGQRLGIIQRRKSRLSRTVSRVLAQMLFDGTSIVVWFAHRRVFKAANLSWRQYWAKCTAEYQAMRRQVAIGLGAISTEFEEPAWSGSIHPAPQT